MRKISEVSRVIGVGGGGSANSSTLLCRSPSVRKDTLAGFREDGGEITRDDKTKPEYKIKSLILKAGEISYRKDIYGSVKIFIIDNDGIFVVVWCMDMGGNEWCGVMFRDSRSGHEFRWGSI